MANTCIPPPLKLLRPSQLNRKYTLEIVQHPFRARCCGFGDKDRRPIDPPPIVKLIVQDEFGKAINIKPEDSVLFLVQCELYNLNKTENRTMVHTPWSLQFNKYDQQSSSTDKSINKRSSGMNDKPDIVRNLIGSSVSNAYHLYDEKNEAGVYFIFNDLSVRTEGEFTLKFVFVDLAAGEPLTMSTFVQQEVFSAPFSVYPAKKFPGLTDSTKLSKCFAQQGIKIAIRSDTLLKRKSNASVYDDDENQHTETQDKVNDSNKSIHTRLSISNFLTPN